MLLLGVPTLLAGGLALRLTETSKRDLPTTLKDAAKMEEEAHQVQEQVLIYSVIDWSYETLEITETFIVFLHFVVPKNDNIL